MAANRPKAQRISWGAWSLMWGCLDLNLAFTTNYMVEPQAVSLLLNRSYSILKWGTAKSTLTEQRENKMM